MKKMLLLWIALLAAYMAKRALTRQPEVITLLWTLIGLTAAASTAGTAKARSTEDRLAGVVAGVGAANSAAGSAQSTANSAASAASNAQSTANNALPTGGGTVYGNLTVTGQISTYQIYVNGNRLNMQQGVGGFPISSGQAWGASVVNVLNNLVSALNNSGVISA